MTFHDELLCKASHDRVDAVPGFPYNLTLMTSSDYLITKNLAKPAWSRPK
jgi:hypothetical protein